MWTIKKCIDQGIFYYKVLNMWVVASCCIQVAFNSLHPCLMLDSCCNKKINIYNPAQCRIQRICIARHLDAITFVTKNIHFWAYLSSVQLVCYGNLVSFDHLHYLQAIKMLPLERHLFKEFGKGLNLLKKYHYRNE